MSTLAIASAVLFALAPVATPTPAPPASTPTSTATATATPSAEPAPTPAPVISTPQPANPTPNPGPIYDQDVTIPYVFLVSGDNAHLVDALTAAPLAAELGAPIFYAEPGGGISDGTLSVIKSMRAEQLIVVGGDVVVSQRTLASAAAQTENGQFARRIWGDDRYATAARVAEFYKRVAWVEPAKVAAAGN